jgi:outer membrane protein assembly factor BamB
MEACFMRLHWLLIYLLWTGFTFIDGSRCVYGDDWPGWRGPQGDGSSRDTGFPLAWNGETGEGIEWKIALPGTGHSSPIVLDKQVFLVACLEETKERILLCIGRETGEERWRRVVLRSPLESKHHLNSYASSTPATDGQSVYVSFLEVDGRQVPAPNVGSPRDITPGTLVVACYDIEGNQRWLKRAGHFLSAHGFCSNPVLFEDLVIVNGDHDGDSYIVALNKSSGDVVWQTERQHKIRSYCTPIIRKSRDRTQMVLSGSQHILSLNPRTGQPWWHVEGPTEQFVASMVEKEGHYFAVAGYPTYHVMSIHGDGNGNVTESHVDWHVTNARCYVPSPVVVDDYLIVADDRGTANCFGTKDGSRLWQERLGKSYSVSLVTFEGLVAFIADDGIVKIIKPGPSLDVVAENPLGEYCFSSPALSDGQWLIRGEKHLFCIGKRHQEDP